MKKSYVYKITCKITGEYYFGSSFDAKSDYYWGGGKRIRERIAQYGKDKFVKEILGEFDDRTIAHQVENQYIEKFRHDDKCLNERLEHRFGLYGEESRTKIGAALRGEKNPNFGKHRTEEVKARISAALRGKTFSEERKARISSATRGEKNHNFGKTFSEEHRAKIGAAHRGEKNPHFGKHWRKNPITGKREYYE